MGDVGKAIVSGLMIVAGIVLTATGIGAQVGIGLIITGAAAELNLIFGQKSMAQTKADQQITTVSTVAGVPVVYGKTLLAPLIVDMRLQGVAHWNDLWVVALYCHGSGPKDATYPGTGVNGRIDSFLEGYLDNKLAFDSSGTLQATFIKDGVSYAARWVSLGADDQGVNSQIASIFASEWDATHAGNGLAYIVYHFTQNTELFASLPAMTQVIKGTKILDTRASSYGWSANPAMCIRDYLLSTRYGLGLDVSEIDEQSFKDEADHCDVVCTHPPVAGNYKTISAVAVPGGSAGGGKTIVFAVPLRLPYPNQPKRVYLTILAHGWADGTQITITGATGMTYINGTWTITYVDANRIMLNGSDWSSGVYSLNSGTATPTLKELTITATAHGLLTNDHVEISLMPGYGSCGLLGLLNADVTITKIDNDQFTFTVNRHTITGMIGVGIGSYVANSARVGKLVTSEPRFTLNGAFDPTGDPTEVLSQLLSSCRGNLVWEGGKYRLFIRKTGSPVLTLTPDQILGSWQFGSAGLQSRWNSLRYHFVRDDRNFDTDEGIWPRQSEANPYLVDDLFYDVQGEIELPFTSNPYTAERIAMTILRENRSGLTVLVTCTEAALAARVGDIVTLIHPTPGWSAGKDFWVERIALTSEGSVQVALREYDATAYSEDGHAFAPLPGAISLDVSFTPPGSPPGLWSLYGAQGQLDSGVTQSGSDGTARALVKGKQVGAAHHGGVVTFDPAFAQPPAVRLSGGLFNEPRSMWGTVANCDGKIITAATTATPIACTCTGHGLTTGAKVSIYRNGATAPVLNLVGQWTITRTDNDHFTLDSSVGAGTYAASSCNVSVGVTAVDATRPQKEYMLPLGLTGSGFTLRALLQQRLGVALTARSVDGAGRATITTIGGTDAVDLGANMPAYEDKFVVGVSVHLKGQTQSGSGTQTLVVALDTNDGGGWVERTQLTFHNSYGSSAPVTFDDGNPATLTVAGMGANDDVRARVVSYSHTGNIKVSMEEWSAGLSKLSEGDGMYAVEWNTGASNDQYASKTPDGADDVRWEAEGYL